jgi:hypothetical protein
MGEENGKKVFRKIKGSTVCFRNGEPQGEARENLLKWEAEKKVKIVEPKTLENKTLTDTEKEHVKMFLLGKPVAELKSGVIKAGEGESAIGAAKKWIRENCKEPVERSDIGEVVLNEKSIADSLAHGFGKKKYNTIPAIQEVIKQGEIIKIHDDFDGKPIKEVLIAAPVKLDSDSDIMIVRLKQPKGRDKGFYLHEITNLEEIKAGEPSRPRGSEKSVGVSRSISHIASILQDIFDVKGKIAKDAADWVTAIEAELYFGDIERRLWGHFRAKEEAALEVMPILGEISPFVYDSAEDIYGEALSHAGWDIAQYPKEAYRGMIMVLLGMRGIKV